MALFGFVKDWVTDEYGADFKWRILGTLLSPPSSSSKDTDIKMEDATSSTHEKANGNVDGNESDSSKLTSLDDHDVTQSPQRSSQINVFEVEVVDQRTRSAIKKQEIIENSEEDELEHEEDYEWGEDEILPVSSTRNASRNSTTPGRINNLPSAGRLSAGRKPPPSVSSEASSSVMLTKNQKSKTKSKNENANAKAKELPVMGFEELCLRIEKGFGELSGGDRVTLLNCMLDSCLVESEKFRTFREQSFEKLSNLNKEKRELIRERKNM